MRGTTSRLFVLGSVAIATLAGARNPAAEILVGYANPLTGEMELAGEQMQNGVELAIAELNAAGGVLGQNVVLGLADDYCDAEQGLAAARKLVADGVAVVMGTYALVQQSPFPYSTRELGSPLSPWRPIRSSPIGDFV